MLTVSRKLKSALPAGSIALTYRIYSPDPGPPRQRLRNDTSTELMRLVHAATWVCRRRGLRRLYWPRERSKVVLDSGRCSSVRWIDQSIVMRSTILLGYRSIIDLALRTLLFASFMRCMPCYAAPCHAYGISSNSSPNGW